jgi:hypothetical protein
MTGIIIQNSPVLNTQGDQSKLLYQVPTITISETGTYDFTGIQAANIFGGLSPAQGPVIIIDAATLVTTQSITFVNTGMKPAVLRLSNAGTVGGKLDYVLMPGNVTFQFDGTNLN